MNNFKHLVSHKFEHNFGRHWKIKFSIQYSYFEKLERLVKTELLYVLLQTLQRLHPPKNMHNFKHLVSQQVNFFRSLFSTSLRNREKSFLKNIILFLSEFKLIIKTHKP
jgi:hypothetical protein